MKPLLIFLCLLFFMGATSCKESRAKGVAKVISPSEVQTLLDKGGMQLVDVRTLEEFNKGHIEGAKHIDYYSVSFASDIKELDKTKPVILYCRSGGRSAKSGNILLDAGFVEIYDLGGGMIRWEKEGFEIKL